MQKLKLQGKDYNVEYSQLTFIKPNVVQYSDRLVVYTSNNRNIEHQVVLVNWLREYARRQIESRVKYYGNNYGFKYKRIAIKDQSTRWGSCSSLGNLNFNWRLILAPQEVLDYVVVHELAHTKEMNHSSRFWDIVAVVLPQYKETKKWLKLNGLSLMKAI